MSEQRPLLRPTPSNVRIDSNQVAELLDFEANDPENPRNWPSAFKWFIVLLLACMATTVTFTCISVVPIANDIITDLNHGYPSSSGSALLVTIWELGEAVGPFLIAPMSEVFGRYPVLNGANLIFISATLFAALCQSPQLFIASRALTGLAVAVNVLNPAIIGDLFPSDQRGSAMSLISLAPLIGGAVGPAVSGVIAERFGWRVVALIGAGLAGLCEVLFLTCFRETYKTAILSQRINELRKKARELDPQLEPEEGLSVALQKTWGSVSRPVTVLSGSGVLLAMSLFGAVAFAHFYVLSVSLPGILRNVYNLSPAETGSSFLVLSVGSLVAIAICNSTLDKIYKRLRGADEGHPEYRLPLAIAAGFMLPVAISLYGWTAQLKLPLWSFLTASGMVNGTVLLIIIPLSAYVVDACGMYSASALTGVIVTRCLMGTFMPLCTDPLSDLLGYGWGMSSFGAVALCLTPIPILVMRYGRKWRLNSEFTRGF